MTLLLTDQRSPEKKAADAALAQFREMFPDITEAWRRVAEAAGYAAGGIIKFNDLMPRDNTMLEAIPFPGTSTGRWRSSGPEYIIPNSRLHRHTVTARLDDINPDHMAKFIGIDIDFSTIEERVLRTLEGKRDYQMELYRMAALYGTAFEDVAAEEPVKQNGRSAAYLKHDKSKSHKRRRR